MSRHRLHRWNEAMGREWLTTGEAAKLLGFSRSTIVRRIDAGYIAAWRLPHGHWRIAKAVVEEVRRKGAATAEDGWPPGTGESRD